MTEVRFTEAFSRRLKKLRKRYRQIQTDLQPIVHELEQGNFIGDQVSGTAFVVLKVRARNSDIPTGKSGGYRIIYQVVSSDQVLLLIIYAKSDQADVSLADIKSVIVQALDD
jgi:addiction module RelE/StbE family toxin